MISVIILTKNNEKTIEKTLNSTKEFKEVLVIDTGSFDKTLKIAENFKNVKIIKSFLNPKKQNLNLHLLYLNLQKKILLCYQKVFFSLNTKL